MSSSSLPTSPLLDASVADTETAQPGENSTPVLSSSTTDSSQQPAPSTDPAADPTTHPATAEPSSTDDTTAATTSAPDVPEAVDGVDGEGKVEGEGQTNEDNDDQMAGMEEEGGAAEDANAERPAEEEMQDQSNNVGGQATTTTTAATAAQEPPEPRIPVKKDVTLREFLGKMDDYAPIIPDAITHHYLTLAGLPPPPQTPAHLSRLLALATQKFIADVAADAYQYARIRSGHTTSNTAAAQGTNVLPGGTAGGVAPGTGVGAGGVKEEKGVAGGLGGQKGVQLGVQRAGFGGGGQGGQGQGRTVLTMEDLGCAVGEYGVNVRRGEFYR